MKTTIRILRHCLPLIGLFCIAPTSSAFYNPEAGRWLNRDPIAESGGFNLFQIANNDLIDFIDQFGACPKKCGVTSIAFEEKRSWSPIMKGGWRIRSGIPDMLEYGMEVRVKPRKDDEYDPKSCRYVQWVSVTLTVNGTKIAVSDRNVPADGNKHLDVLWPTPPGWTDDDISKHLNLLPIPDGNPWTQADSPGFSVAPGDTVNYNATFTGQVIDITENLKVVATATKSISASGRYRRFTVSPGSL